MYLSLPLTSVSLSSSIRARLAELQTKPNRPSTPWKWCGRQTAKIIESSLYEFDVSAQPPPFRVVTTPFGGPNVNRVEISCHMWRCDILFTTFISFTVWRSRLRTDVCLLTNIAVINKAFVYCLKHYAKTTNRNNDWGWPQWNSKMKNMNKHWNLSWVTGFLLKTL